MIVLRLVGNIGEQLFQYAAARNYSIINNCNLLLDFTWYIKNRKSKIEPNKPALDSLNTNFGIAGSVITNNFLRIKDHQYLSRFPQTAKYKVIEENKKMFSSNFLTAQPPFYMIGDFKNEKYFEESVEQIIEDFTVKIDYLKKNKILINQINSSESIGIFISKRSIKKNRSITTNLIDFNYYQKAVEHFENILINPYFFIFTDAEKDELESLKFCSSNQIIVLFKNDTEWKNVYFLSKCKYLIANDSATSWWAAWLNFTNNRTVIIPENFSFEYPNITHNKLGIQQNWIKL
ncbi:MAG: alpha-1,2-fucosyltransferase [Bacteroidetes bacterium]|nr:alpha-1,2-fucosyltransferase [Bacteroidota bacterium]